MTCNLANVRGIHGLKRSCFLFYIFGNPGFGNLFLAQILENSISLSYISSSNFHLLTHHLTLPSTALTNHALKMDPSKVSLPPMKDLTIENITENVHAINSQTPDPRLRYLMERLVQHLHDFARETRLSTEEWMAGIEFLTQVGKTCTNVRQVRGLDPLPRRAERKRIHS